MKPPNLRTGTLARNCSLCRFYSNREMKCGLYRTHTKPVQLCDSFKSFKSPGG